MTGAYPAHTPTDFHTDISFLRGKWFLDHRGFCAAVLWFAAGIKLAAGLTLPHRIQVY